MMLKIYRLLVLFSVHKSPLSRYCSFPLKMCVHRRYLKYQKPSNILCLDKKSKATGFKAYACIIQAIPA